MAPAQSSDSDRAVLKKSLSPLHVGALALGCIIGWGCFILPGIRFLPEAGPLAAIIGFALGAFMLIFVALSYGKMVENYPVAGGGFVYAYIGFGPTAAFICGWALVLGYLCIIALNGTALSLMTRFLLPGVFEWGYLYSIAGWEVYTGELLFVSGMILLFGIINYRGGGSAGCCQLILAILLVGGTAALAVSAFAAPTASLSNLEPFYAEGRGPLTCILGVVAIAPWLYVGFDTIPQAAEEFDFSHQKSTRLMLVAIIMGAVLYALVTLSVAVVIPYTELLAQKPVWAAGTIAEMTMGRIGSFVLALAVLGAICSGINGFYIASSRLIFGMARSRFLPQWFGEVHPVFHTPHNAIIFTIAMSLLAPWCGREALSWVVDMSAIGTVIAYGFTSLTAWKYMSANPLLPGSFKGKCYALLGTFASFLCLALLTVPGSPAAIAFESWVALVAWAAMGGTFYLTKAKEVHSLSTGELSLLLLGSKDRQVFFEKPSENRKTAVEPTT